MAKRLCPVRLWGLALMSFYATDEEANGIGQELVRRILEEYGPKGLDAGQFAITLLLHHTFLEASRLSKLRGVGYRAAQLFYPCSVVKLFYLVAARARMEEKFIAPHEELDRAMRDMILVSSNTATNYVIDLVTDTTGDTLLADEERLVWEAKRQWVNRYFHSWGWPEFEHINLTQKLMDDQRYGREQMFVGANGRNHNALTTDATARLFYGIFTGQIVNKTHSKFIAETLARSLDPEWIAAEPGAQVNGFFGAGLPQGSRLWSKAGMTGWTGDSTASYRRHDAAYVELPDGPAFTLVAFTQGKGISTDDTCLPAIASTAVDLICRR